jgi:hypothetical protein
MAVLRNHAGNAECRGRSQNSAHIARVGHLVEHQDRAGVFQQLVHAGRGQRVGQEGGALVHDIMAEELVDPGAVCAFGGERPGLRVAFGERGFGLLGEQEAAEAPVGVRQSGGDGVQAVEPECAGGRGRRARAGGRPRLRAGSAVALKWLALWFVAFGAAVPILVLCGRAGGIRGGQAGLARRARII